MALFVFSSAGEFVEDFPLYKLFCLIHKSTERYFERIDLLYTLWRDFV